MEPTLPEASTSQVRTTSNVSRIHRLIEHTESVMFCVLDNHKRMLLTGGVDDTAYVWNMLGYHPKFECRGHKETVLAGDFSMNSNLVASGDMSGLVQAFDCNTGNRIFSFDIDEIKWIKFHNISEYVLLAGTAKGDFWMWHIHDPNAVRCFPSYGSATTNAALCDDGGFIMVSYGDGSVRLINLKDSTVLLKYEEGSKSEILSMSVAKAKDLLAIGCMDSSVKIIKMKNFKCYQTLYCTTPTEEKDKLTQNYKKACKEVLDRQLQRQTKKPGLSNDVFPQLKNDIGSCSVSDSTKYEDDDNVKSRTDESFGLERASDVGVDDDEPEPTSPSGAVIYVPDPDDEEVEDDPTRPETNDNDVNHEVDREGENLEYEIDNEELDLEDETYDSPDAFDSLDLTEAVESVAFSHDAVYLAGVNNLGSIFIWETNSLKERVQCHIGTGICKVAWNNKGQLVVGCSDGNVRIFDANLNLIEKIQAHNDQILDLIIRDDMIVTTSDDKTGSVIIMNSNN